MIELNEFDFLLQKNFLRLDLWYFILSTNKQYNTLISTILLCYDSPL